LIESNGKDLFTDRFQEAKIILKIIDYAQGQGASRRKSVAYIRVCEHFKKVCNAAIGY
jgi:hypothetical protein